MRRSCAHDALGGSRGGGVSWPPGRSLPRRLAILALAIGLAAGPAPAQTSKGLKAVTTIQCIEPSGQSIPPVCDAPASRLDTREYICTCPGGGMRVDVPVCAKDQREPPEGRALVRARRDAAKDGSLVGDMVDGKAICVAPRGRP